jgi:hypothetical protein
MGTLSEESPPYLAEPLRSFTPIKLENGDLRMAIATAGQGAYNAKGQKKILSEKFLSTCFFTWENGLVSTNHENTNPFLNEATLYDLEYDSENKLVIASFANLPEKARRFLNSEFYAGLSQECVPESFSDDGEEVVSGHGTGCTIVMWPHKPAASPETGVGVRPALAAILASKYPDQKIQSDGNMTDPKGGGTPAISEEAFLSIVSEKAELKSQVMTLESEKKNLETELASTKNEYEQYKSGEVNRTKIAVESAIESHDADLRETAEKEAVVSELRSYLGDKTDRFLDENPSIGLIKATIEIQKEIVGNKKVENSTQVGSSQNTPNDKGKSYAELNSAWNARLGRA